MEFYHEPVMALNCVNALNIKENGIYVDGTAGGGGHSLLIAKALKTGKLICIDKDIEALQYTTEKLDEFKNIIYVNDDFKNLMQILEANEIGLIDGILLDLGVSSYQLDNADRGFSYMKDARLDMRMDRSGGKSAFDIINGYEEDKLTYIFFKYGEEKFSKRIASFIVRARKKKAIETTLELASVIEDALPARARAKGSHPAKRVFQAVRIEVNGELEGLYDFIISLPNCLNEKGRIAVITFHSLEDRIVKQAFNEMMNPCVCPSDFPICVCGKKSQGKPVFKKPVTPEAVETERNPRSKSAKLRVFEKA